MAVKTILITGTHLTPAWALIEELKKNKYRVMYLGRSRSMRGSAKSAAEKQLLTNAGVEFYPLLNMRWPKVLLTFVPAVIQALVYLIKLKPKAVVSFGGNVALPVCIASYLRNIPVVIHEQTFGAGLTNRLSAPLAKVVAVSWKESLKFFPKGKTVVTGNPLRRSVLMAKKMKRRTGQKTLYITGGNQGSLTINAAVTEILPELLKKFRVYHQFGLTQNEALWLKQSRWASTLPETLKKNYFLKRWFTDEELTQILLSRPLTVCRAGANTVTELAFLNLPAVIIPLPIAAKNEQQQNAEYLKKRGLAVILKQDDLTPKSLNEAIKEAQKISPKKAFFPPPSPVAARKLYQLIVKAAKNV